ncbi:MAG TPA: hypothetical protein ENI44_05455 [Thermoplasmatales archaeon]|nr:hypothetical protein [Thermoplasmatales archaeon]
MVPSIGAVEYNIAEKVNKDFLSRETHRFIDSFRGFNSLFQGIIQLRESNVLSVDLSFFLTVLVACVIAPVFIMTIGFFFSDLFGLAGMNLVSKFFFWLTYGAMAFLLVAPGLLSINLFGEKYGEDTARSIGLLFLLLDAVIALLVDSFILW